MISAVNGHYEPIICGEVDTLMRLLAFQHTNTVIPELLNILGKEKFMEFLDIFAGVSIQIPSSESILQEIENSVIYSKISNIKGSKKVKENRIAKEVQKLALQMKMKPHEIEIRYKVVKRILDRLNT